MAKQQCQLKQTPPPCRCRSRRAPRSPPVQRRSTLVLWVATERVRGGQRAEDQWGKQKRSPTKLHSPERAFFSVFPTIVFTWNHKYDVRSLADEKVRLFPAKDSARQKYRMRSIVSPRTFGVISPNCAETFYFLITFFSVLLRYMFFPFAVLFCIIKGGSH